MGKMKITEQRYKLAVLLLDDFVNSMYNKYVHSLIRIY